MPVFDRYDQYRTYYYCSVFLTLSVFGYSDNDSKGMQLCALLHFLDYMRFEIIWCNEIISFAVFLEKMCVTIRDSRIITRLT